MGQSADIRIIDINSGEQVFGSDNIFQTILPTKEKALASLWGFLDQSFITGHENGKLIKWDIRNPTESLKETEPHKAQINDLQYNKDQTLFVSASKDNTAKVFFSFN